MNLLPLALLYLLGREGKGGSAPRWPSPRHPPPRHPGPRHAHHAHHSRHAAQPHHAAHRAHHSAHPAEHHQVQHHAPEHHVHHEVHHDQPHVVHHPAHHHAATHPMAAPAFPIVLPQENAQQESLPELHAAPPEPAAATTAETPPPAGTSVASVQRILVGLGWRGHLTTQGALQPSLTDGEYGPVTHDDWQQSARKRGLDPAFERLGPNTVEVNPDTYAALRELARSRGATVDGRRRPYIP